MTDRFSPERVADELAIRNLLAQLVWHADNTTIDDIDEYVDCFTVDAEWEMRGDVRRGHDEIRQGGIDRREAGTMGPGSKIAHFLSVTLVAFEDADTASAKSYIQAYREANTNPTITVMGQYHDVFRRTDRGWKLHRRRVDFTWT
ncbi:MAG: nuclear transport factor 2 family protein [Acidimicrobiia bacterium]